MYIYTCRSTSAGHATLAERRISHLHKVREHTPKRIDVNRQAIESDVLRIYSDCDRDILDSQLYVCFTGENACDMSGVTREMFSTFYRAVSAKYFEGGMEMVPRVDPDTCNNELFRALGRVISHCYLITGMFPIFIAKAALLSLYVRPDDITDLVLKSSFMNYIDDFEKVALLKFINKESIDEDDQDVITCLLSRFSCFMLPTRENIEQVVISTARSELLCRPLHALKCIQRGMIDAHPLLWEELSEADIDCIYRDLVPTPIRVWKTICAPDVLTRQQDITLDYLRRFILSLDRKKLSLFLRFATGSSLMTSVSINVTFNSTPPGYTRSPGANTCSSTLILPTSYQSFMEFKSEFVGILNNSDMWYMDAQ